MGINYNEGPRLLRILKPLNPGAPPIEVYSLVRRYNGHRPRVRRTHWRSAEQVDAIALHHDGVFYSGRDANFNGMTIDEDIARMDADYRAVNEREGLNPERHAYHLMASHERLYLTLDLGVIGAHAAGNNTRAIGICGLGIFVSQPPPLAQIVILGGAGSVAYRWLQRLVTISGHRQFPRQGTVCPGDAGMGVLPAVRWVAKRFA